MDPLAQSAAIILGASDWPKYPAFQSHPAFKNSADFVREYLLGHGLLRGNLLPLFDDESQPGIILERLRQFLDDRSSQGVRNVLLYYVGHGGLRDNGYFLAMRCTSADEVEDTALNVGRLARALRQRASNARQVVIIDACYAAAAVGKFIYQSGTGDIVDRQIREQLPDTDVERGTCLLCAAAARVAAKIPVDSEYTMFTGALRGVLRDGDATAGELLSIGQVADLVRARIFKEFADEAVRPELHLPRQEAGSVSTLRLFPNPAATDDPAKLRGVLARLGHEASWEGQSRRDGHYELVEIRKTIDQFGDARQSQRILGIHGPHSSRIASIPYKYEAMPHLGTCVIDRITDEQAAKDIDDLPQPAITIEGALTLDPVATEAIVHKGFTVETRQINSFALTTRDAILRGHGPFEQTSYRPRYHTRWLRLAVTFPRGYEPTASPRVVAWAPGSGNVSSGNHTEDQTETERIQRGLFWDQRAGCAVLNIERAVPHRHYAIRWKLPIQPTSPLEEGEFAREQVRDLLNCSKRRRNELDKRLRKVRDGVCRAHLGLRGNRIGVDLTLYVFDEQRSVARVVGATYTDEPRRGFELPWGAGVVGWTMRRRNPAFVDINNRGNAGIYRQGPPPHERFLFCVPIPLPSHSPNRRELLMDTTIPCAVVTMSCIDETGNLERLKSETLMPKVASAVLDAVLASITNLKVSS